MAWRSEVLTSWPSLDNVSTAVRNIAPLKLWCSGCARTMRIFIGLVLNGEAYFERDNTSAMTPVSPTADGGNASSATGDRAAPPCHEGSPPARSRRDGR